MTKKGISLIILIITIIIMIILAGAVILSFSQNNVIETTNEAVFKNDVKVFESDLNMYITKEYVDTMGLYNVKSLNADDLHAEYNGQIIANKTIKDIISTLATREKYNGKFEIFEGKLVYKGVRAEEVTWSGEVNVGVIDGNRVDTTISTSIVLPISAGTDAICTIRMLSNAGINNIDLNGKLELLDENSIPLANQPVFDIGSPSGSNTDTLRSVDVNINIDTLAEGKYKLKLKSGAISNINDITNTVDTVSDILFEVDNTPPENPVISANPTEWTNGNVLVTLTYSADTIKKEYSLDGTNWNIYSSTVEVTEYNTTVYARSKDTAGNTSGQSTITIANIDKDSPTVVFGTNGGTNLQTASTNVTITDVGSSGINTSLSKYIWDTQNEIVPVSGWTNYVNEEIVTKTGNGTYYLWIQAEDNTGNSIVTKSNGFILDNIAPINPTMVANPTSWTNGNVTVTITYPADATVKEYSTNGTTWTIYTVPVIVATNNVTVYARGRDASGNQSSQSSLTVSNIDKISPTVTFGTNGGTNLQTATTTATVSDTGGSTVNTSTIQYVWDTQNTVAPSSGWAVFTNGASLTKGSVTGTYYLWIKGLDTAGNTVVSKTNAFEIDNTAPTNPTLVANPTSWTNGNVLVTITYPADATVKEYSTNGTSWSAYTTAITVTTNNTTVYARGRDASGNQSGQGTLTVSNIDKIVPTVSFGTNGGTNLQTATTTATVSDTGGSTVNTSTIQYVWDTQNTVAPSSGWAVFTNGLSLTKGSVTGTYYLWIKGSDTAGNTVVSKTNAFEIDNTAPTNPTLVANPTSWTNGNVLVTITYPADATVKEYSTNGTSWSAYTTAITVTTNITTVYARGRDASGNQSSQSTLTVSNIDKIVPTVSFGTNGGSNLQTASTTVTVSDTGGSAVNTSTIQYVWDIQNTVAPSSGWLTFTNGVSLTKGSVTGTYYLWIKGSDNAGNTIVSKTNAFVLDNTAPTNPTLVASPTSWTNGNVSVTITYPADATVKEYSTNGTTWNTYTTAITVTTNNTTVYARGRDASGNQSGQGTLTVSNIDKIVPSAFTITSSNLTATGFTITTAALNGTGSGISKVDYYVNDVLKSSSTATTYIVTGLSVQSATAYVIVHDQAGNSTRSTNTLNVSLHTHNDLCYSHKHTVSCYTTHSHSGSSTSGGGCYGGANYIYHTSHNSSCYSYSDYTHTHASYCYITNTTTCYGTVSWSYIGVYVASHTCAGNGTVTADRYSGTCNTCGASKGIFHRNTICSACTYNYEGYLPNTCSKSTTATVLNCGLSEGVTYTSSTLTCTKTSSTIDGISSYYLTCGKTAGQSYLTCGKIENLTLTCGY